jgi:hypothetical protein
MGVDADGAGGVAADLILQRSDVFEDVSAHELVERELALRLGLDLTVEIRGDSHHSELLLLVLQLSGQAA